jgi:hypothetical protein
MKRILKRIFKIFRRIWIPVNWYNLRSTIPISSIFGLDRGTPIDRVYIEYFLEQNKRFIKGNVMEIGENTYTKKFGSLDCNSLVFHFDKTNKEADIIGDLTNYKDLPKNKVDCFIITQTLNFIYDYKSAIIGINRMLKKNGVALITVAGLVNISKYDYERWGDFYRFTDLTIKKSLGDMFGEENIEVETYGNLLTVTSLLHGISSEELSKDELYYKDTNYQLIITAKVLKK